MPNVILHKKLEKRKKLLDSSYELFVEKGISNVSIAEICQKAGIAKGTFYLYFTSKEDIARALNRRISFTLMQKAYDEVNRNRKDTFADNVITMANFIIDYFHADTETLKMMRKDFIFPLTVDDFDNSTNPLMISLRQEISDYARVSGYSNHEILFRLYSLLSMIAGICHSVIIDHFPDTDIDDLKPVLFDMIRKAIQP
ncbi:MAG: TetR/AcrR family transcriptional regulator [Erysipelotrichaceae bacterium]|jgi:AcrR family transcriptional regulator|nr:TetR/AcrR family transcriptional regulator [Lactimicrobium massiliense]MCH4019821.1 TetR/AcrR family transcriptional regulator [Erysipelotrichaceae bacterium]MCI1326600.1 TetR/AcrR family transcriptional regulator [Solobacterium sp.]MCH4045185.1 TetR/AcrR family transcriptional regulator [Erysipelotrichaceae bacterium]MCH4122396.1 TetR/AcrR family transcriptional regulator [Erysipelotrichaceae bacterium]MCI1362971.1 TetR/AcrR family transcriptional regulator [Solobacterium sp.]